jgi:hypothetical protein
MRYSGRLSLWIVPLGALVGSLTFVAPVSAPAAERLEKKDEPARFVRLSRDQKKQPKALETAIVSHVPRDCGRNGPTVDLIAALHVADKSYYEELNRLFGKYDVVLYELVAPEGIRIPKGGGSGSSHPVSVLQNTMTGILALEFQLRGIDYTKGNLVHADMSPEQFAAAMRDRGDSFWTILARVMGHAFSSQSDSTLSDARLLVALFDKNRALALKRVLAEEFLDLDDSISAIEGPNGSAIIADRNKVALKVLRKQIDAGKQKIAVFYGAGHMPDFQERLRDEFGLVPISTRWLVAWNLAAAAEPKPAAK